MPTQKSPFQPSAPIASGAPGASGRIGNACSMRPPARLSWTSGPGMFDTIAWKYRHP